MFNHLFLVLFFLIGAAILAGMTTALLQMGKIRAKEAFRRSPSLFFFYPLLKPLFGKQKWEGLLFTLSFSKHVLHLAYGIFALFFLLTQEPFSRVFHIFEAPAITLDTLWVVVLCLVIVVTSLITETVLKVIAMASPSKAFLFFAPIASFFLTLFSPLTLFFFRILPPLFLGEGRSREGTSSSIREKILDVLYESDLSARLDPQERKLILSVASFKERIVREVMVPRIDVFSLSRDTTVEEAARLFLREGYSRIPVYHDDVDHIIGVLLYKDIVPLYALQGKEVKGSIESLIKPALYTPETKKISSLLQEFRSKKIHLAIVVDEYGGTEGIVTIEDILEELVGEISDEYDSAETNLYTPLPAGGWIVDARMNILDIERELGVKIPSGPEYDTLSGYVFHEAGLIPPAGWRFHHDAFDLEIISSDDRSIDKVRIVPLSSDDGES
jgi:CBS domain containing-hemolysin-like protein